MVNSNQYEVKVHVNELRRTGFTPLDTLQGKVHLNLRSELSINCIQLKFKGVSSSVLKQRQKEKVIIKEENHILVNDIQTVFPKREPSIHDDTKTVFNLKPGEYQYDFEIKIPLNTSCINKQAPNSKSISKFMRLSGRSSSSLSMNEHDTSAGGLFPRHLQSVLPPTFKERDSSIEYILKVVIIRPSLLRANIKYVKPVIITPFNGVEYLHKSKLLNYVRKQTVLKDKLPEIVAVIEPPITKKVQRRATPQKSSFKSFLLGPSPSPKPILSTSDRSKNSLAIIHSHDVPFYFEARSFGFIQVIGKPLHFKLLLVTKISPVKYLAIDGNSSGLGAVYFHGLDVKLHIYTKVKSEDLVKETKEVVTLEAIQLSAYKLDLAYAKEGKAINEKTGNPLYELEIPSELYSGIVIPDTHALRTIYQAGSDSIAIVPSFKTCHIERLYKVKISATFTEAVPLKSPKQIELELPVNLLSGIDPPVGFETLPPPTRSLPSYEEVTGN